MRLPIALFLIVLAVLTDLAVRPAGAQTTPANPEDSPSYDVIDAPPPGMPAPTPDARPSTGVILDRPGSVLLYGTPVKLRFQSPTDVRQPWPDRNPEF